MDNFVAKISFAILTSFSLVAPVLAQQPDQYEDHVLSDGELTKEELAAVLLRAKNDLTSLLETAVENVEKDVEAAGVFSPRAWMLMKDESTKEVTLSGQAEQAPADIKVHMFRASLKSVARHNRIDSALIVYPGTIQMNGMEQRIVAVEHEHRLGVSGIKLIPLDLDNGSASFGTPLSQEKPFAIFYDDKAGNS